MSNPGATIDSPHKPVLLQEVMDILSPKDGGIYVDATFGGGGYSRRILDTAQCIVHGVDRDSTVEQYFALLLRDFPNRVTLSISRFSKLKTILQSLGVTKVDGIVFDLGMSSMQINDQDRGFSFMHNAPLDMRMDHSSSKTAGTFVNTLLEKDMADIIYYYGGERCSRRVARAIVDARQKRNIYNTEELAKIIRSVVPRSKINPIDPATRTFQAIRIWVNDELEELQLALSEASKLLETGGKIIVVSFHSLEDRIVKHTFNSMQGNGYKIFNKKVIKPTEEEIANNPRSRSGRLRAIVRAE